MLENRLQVVAVGIVLLFLLSATVFYEQDSYDTIGEEKELLDLNYELADDTVVSVNATWTSRTSAIPASYDDGDTLVGDHVIIQNVWNMTSPIESAEYYISNSQILLTCGQYAVRNGTYVNHSSGNWPISYLNNSNSLEGLKGIKADESVRINLTSAENNDPYFEMYKWVDENADEIVGEDEILPPFLLVDNFGQGHDESWTYTVPEDMDIAVRVSSWLYAHVDGINYTLTLDTRTTFENDAEGATAILDTYELRKNTTAIVSFTAWLNNGSKIIYVLGNVTFCNFFKPEVRITEPDRLVDIVGDVVITWTVTDDNADDEHFFEVLLSADGGDTFQLLAKNITMLTYTWDSSGFLVKDTYDVMVRVYDNDAIENPNGISTGDYWPGLYGYDATDSWGSTGPPGPPSSTPTPPTDPTETDNPLSGLWFGLIGGVAIGAVVILVLFFSKKRSIRT